MTNHFIKPRNIAKHFAKATMATPNDIASELLRDDDFPFAHHPECRCSQCCEMRKHAENEVQPVTINHFGSNSHSGGRITKGEQ